MSILGSIKKGVKSSGSNKGKILYFRDGAKVRVRFLHELEDGIEISQHDAFDDGINFFDQEAIRGEAHELQEDESLRHRQAYVFCVWDYDAKEVKLLVGYANNFSPLPALVGMHDAYDTIVDRDYVITRSGSQLQTSYTVVPMDKVKFKNAKAKPYSEKKILSILDKAFPAPGNEEDDDEDEKPSKSKNKGKGAKGKKQRKPEPEEIEDDDDFEDEETENDYEDMSPRELYMECMERGLKAKKKQKAKYYIDLLVEDDESNEDSWDNDEEEDNEDDW